jgi:poly(3-hydroxybutyrate) depolymerase
VGRVVGRVSRDIDATRVMLDFFERVARSDHPVAGP